MLAPQPVSSSDASLENSICHADCVSFMKQMPASSVDLTVTSPPYDDLRHYKGYTFPFDSIARQLFRVTKTGGIVVWVVGDRIRGGKLLLPFVKPFASKKWGLPSTM